MDLKQRIKAFGQVGLFFKQFQEGKRHASLESIINKVFYEPFFELLKSVKIYNGWFTEENILNSLNALAGMLEEEKINRWLSEYEELLSSNKNGKKIAVVMAGNIPLAGFHDFLTVLLSGNTFIGKLSSQDKHLLPFIAEVLIAVEPGFKDRIYFADMLKGMDAIIATGSDNSARYFEYYFGKYPHIIRKNRNSVAVLTGKENEKELENLGKDIFLYFGLGCRNVSKLMVPIGYNFDNFFKGIYSYKDIINNNKYGNNYDYNKVVYLMNKIPLLENGFLLLKEDIGLSSPVATLYYEYYNNENRLKERLDADSAHIQCIISHLKINNSVKFGEAQFPELRDYADGVDTMSFLLRLP